MATIEKATEETMESGGKAAQTIVSEPLPARLQQLAPDSDTLPKHLLLRTREMGDRVAIRKKRYGIWQEYTWKQSYQRVHDFCLGSVSLGLARGDKVAIIGENDPEFYWAEMAAHSTAAATISIFPDASLQELDFLINDSGASFLVAHDQEQCDKALEIREKLSNVRKVIYWDDRGLWNYDDDWLISFTAVEELGRAHAAQNPGLFEKLIMEGSPDDIAILSYTSGTTGAPKGAMISHSNLIYGNQQSWEAATMYPVDNYVSFSPLAWITEQAIGFAGHLTSGFQVNFPEGPETVQTDIREIAPSEALFPSRLWENLVSAVQVRINDSFWVNRKLFETFMPARYQIIDKEDNGESIGPYLRLMRWLGELLVFRPLRDKLGLTQMRHAFSSGAVLAPDQLRFLRAIGVRLKNLYGSTECQIHTLHRDDDIRLATVGRPAPGVEIKVLPSGELCVRSRAVFKGYHNKPEKTAEALDDDGWFHTGDAGNIDADGHVVYIDRVTDMVELGGGEHFSPQYIEGRLKFCPYIQDVMAVGGNETEFVTAIVNIDFENVSRWAESNHIAFTTFVDLSQRPEVYELISGEFRRVNESLSAAAHIKKFMILHKGFDADEAELTRTRKLRRGVLGEKYGEMLAAMYDGRQQVDVRAEVKYRDGRTGTIETAIKVYTL